MYNRYKKGTEAWYAMEDAISAVKEIESGSNAAEDVFERIIDELDDAEAAVNEAEEERDEYEKELEELQSKYEELHATQPELITMLTNLKVATEGINKYVTDKLVSLGALNETQDIDSGPGDSGDGGAENPDGKNDGSPIT